MAGDQASPVTDEVMQQFGPQHVVVDVIYFPLETPFLKAAAKQGSHTYNGIGMLVNQAADLFGMDGSADADRPSDYGGQPGCQGTC